MAKKDRHIVLFVIDRFEFKDKDSGALTGKGFELRVVHVISEDQKSRGAGVEKVYFYEGGSKSIPKVLQAKDLSKLKEKWADVKHYLDNPGPVPPLPLPESLGGGGDLGGGGLGGGAGLGGGSLGSGIEKTGDF
jgi:hypothetical protein